MKKVIALIMALLMCATVIPVSASSPDSICTTPIVYCLGQGSSIYNKDGEKVYGGDSLITDEFLSGAVSDCMPSFLEAVKSDTDEAWEAYYEKLASWLFPIMKPFALDKNGEISNGTYADIDQTVSGDCYYEPLGGYNLADWNKFVFKNDWRLDPFTNADILHRYIQDVKRVTGKEKVNLVGRCEGGNIVLAYLQKYGYQDVNCLEFYVSSVKGVETVTSLFSGNLYFDSLSINRFKEQSDLLSIEDQIIAEFIDSTLALATDTFALDLAAGGLTLYAQKIYNKVLTKVIRETYGTFPGIWSLVNENDYPTARKKIFKGVEDEYAGLIQKIDHYNEKIRLHIDDILLDASKNGVKIAVYAKYGEYQIPPFCKSNNELSDYSVTLGNSSFGATASMRGKTLSDSYIASAGEKAKYISPDKMVDASTALFPDTTWFIYNVEHKDFPNSIHRLMQKFLNSDGEMTVFTDASAPQYLCAAGDNNDPILVPLTAENGYKNPVKEPITGKSIKDKVLDFINKLLAFLRSIIFKLLNK